MEYTNNQIEIIKQTEGPVLVIACPGSGKTTTVIGRVDYMVKEKKIPPNEILVVTFTKSAAEEMQKRYESCNNFPSEVIFSTIHSLCYNVLKERYNFSFNSIVKTYEQYKFFAEIMNNRVNPRDIEDVTKLAISKISYVRNADIPYKLANVQEFSSDDFEFYYEEYEKYKKKNNKIDFDDMLIMCRNLFKTEPATLSIWQNRFSHIIIDEFQDTNKIQADIFDMVADKTKNICVVGDDDQSIYGFRSADSSIMLNFEKKYKNCKRFSLDTNYRSNKEIISSASRLIGHNEIRFKKKFKGAKKENGKITFFTVPDSSGQTNFVFDEIEKIHKAGTEYKDIAILYRNNKLAIPFVGKFMNEKIPFVVKDPPKNIFKDIIYTDIKGYYNLAFKKEESGDFIRVLNHPTRFLKKEIFKDFMYSDFREIINACERCSIPALARKNVYQFKSDISKLKITDPKRFIKTLRSIGYMKWLLEDYACFSKRSSENLKEMFSQLKEDASEYNTMEEWLAHGDKMAKELDKKEPSKEGVILSTFHSAKGLEWKYVFVVSVDSGIVPSKYAETKLEIEEERRAFYVAITRAKEALYVCSSKPEVSSFVKEMKKELQEM